MNRDETVIAIRPEIKLTETPQLPIEQFMHTTLRPILKFQHIILVSWFEDFIERNKISLPQHPKLKSQAIEDLLKVNQKLRHAMFGLVSGHFTQLELNFYLQHYTELNKRIVGMIVKRIHDHYQLRLSNTD